MKQVIVSLAVLSCVASLNAQHQSGATPVKEEDDKLQIVTKLNLNVGLSFLPDRKFDAKPIGEGQWRIVEHKENYRPSTGLGFMAHFVMPKGVVESNRANVIKSLIEVVSLGTWREDRDSFGFSIGSNLNLSNSGDSAPASFLFGWSYFYGRGQDINTAVTFGVEFRNVERLRFDAVGDTIASSQIDTRTTWRPGFYIGISFMLNT